MINLVLLIMLIVSLSKPDVLLSKKIREKANDEQKIALTKNLRKIYGISIGLIESGALLSYFEGIGIILGILFLVLFFKISLPAIKENSRIIKELDA